MILGFIDTETESWLDIKAAGTIRYAEVCRPLSVHVIAPESEQVARYETKDGPVPVWLDHLLMRPDIIWVANNAMFDRWVVVEGLGYYNLADPERWLCTAALGRYAGLPGKLDKLGERLDLPFELRKRDDSGGIEHFTKLYSKKHRQPHEDPERWESFMSYGDQDTLACKAVYLAIGRRLPKPARDHWREHELQAYHLDQRVNDQGIPVDPDALRSAMSVIETVQPQLEREMAMRTGGEVTKVGSPKLKDYLNSEYLLALPNLQKDTLQEALEVGELPAEAEALVRLRLHGAKNSLAKYRRMDAMMSADRRVRAGFLYHGAHTGRWSGQGFQPQNLTRPAEGLDPVEVAAEIARAGGDAAKLAEAYPEWPIYEVLVSGIRGAIRARPGHVLVIADYNQIESRLTAYFAACETKLRAFADHDTGASELDPYEVTAMRVMGLRGKPTAEQRHAGKTMDLGLGFGMGSVKFAAVTGLPFVRAREMVDGWRETYPEVPALWDAANWTFQAALGNQQCWSRHDHTNLAFAWLQELGIRCERDKFKTGMLTLPTNKPLFYHTLRHATWSQNLAQAKKYGRLKQALEAFERRQRREYDPERDGKLIDQNSLAFTSQYGAMRLVHGGFFTENFVQGTARELMVLHALGLYLNNGWVPVLHSHDELVYEVPEKHADMVRQEVQGLMEWSPPCVPHLPLRAEVKVSERYTK